VVFNGLANQLGTAIVHGTFFDSTDLHPIDSTVFHEDQTDTLFMRNGEATNLKGEEGTCNHLKFLENCPRISIDRIYANI